MLPELRSANAGMNVIQGIYIYERVPFMGEVTSASDAVVINAFFRGGGSV